MENTDITLSEIQGHVIAIGFFYVFIDNKSHKKRKLYFVDQVTFI